MYIFITVFLLLCGITSVPSAESSGAPQCPKTNSSNGNEPTSPLGWNCDMEDGVRKCYQYNYYYDNKTDSCKPFDFQGCGANENNFESMPDCIAHCKRKSQVVFPIPEDLKVKKPWLYRWMQTLPNCTNMTVQEATERRITRFFYDTTTKKCKEVNVERGDPYFPTMSYCVDKCNATEKSLPRCNLPMVLGNLPSGWNCTKDGSRRVCTAHSSLQAKV